MSNLKQYILLSIIAAMSVVALVFSYINYSSIKKQKTVACINYQEILIRYTHAADITKEITNDKNKVNAILDSLVIKFKIDMQEYERKRLGLNKTELEHAMQEIKQKENFINQYKQYSSSQINQKEAELMAPLLEEISNAAQLYGKTSGYTAILGLGGDGSVLYGDSTIDISKEIIEVLNKEYAKNNKTK